MIATLHVYIYIYIKCTYNVQWIMCIMHVNIINISI